MRLNVESPALHRSLVGAVEKTAAYSTSLPTFLRPLIPITERFLSECGGWQVLREARSIHDAGRVLEVSYTPPTLQGRVKTADSEVRAGLKILSASNVENLCTCRESRREGRICAHSLALGLEIAKPKPKTAAPGPLKTTPAPATATPPSGPGGPQFSTEQGIPASFQVIFPPDFPAAWDKGSLMVAFEAQVEGRRVMLQALDKAKTYRVDLYHLALAAKLSSLVGQLPRALAATRGFPRSARRTRRKAPCELRARRSSNYKRAGDCTGRRATGNREDFDRRPARLAAGRCKIHPDPGDPHFRRTERHRRPGRGARRIPFEARGLA